MNNFETKYVLEPKKQIFKYLRDYIMANASVSTWVGRVKIDDRSPMVVFEESRNELVNYSTTYDNTTRLLNYNINIYCSDLSEKTFKIAEEIEQLVIEVMEGVFHMQGGTIARIPTYDSNNKNCYQINLRYTTNYKPKELKIY